MRGLIDCPCGCGLSLQPKVKWIVESLERFIKEKINDNTYEIFITSGARCDTYNNKKGYSKNSVHTLSLACDIETKSSKIKYLVLEYLFSIHIKRVGFAKGFIHFDIATGLVKHPREDLKEYPQEVCWDY